MRFAVFFFVFKPTWFITGVREILQVRFSSFDTGHGIVLRGTKQDCDGSNLIFDVIYTVPVWLAYCVCV